MDVATTLSENQSWLRAVVYSRLGDRNATEDVLQEISLALMACERRNVEPVAIRGWLYQVAVKQVVLFRRRETRYRQRIERYQASQIDVPEVFGLERMCATDQLEAVRANLEKLRPCDKQILVLKYSEDLSCKKIATLLGVTETTVQSRLLRARRRLKSLLNAHSNR